MTAAPLILTLDEDERDQRDKLVFEISQSPLALEQALGELLVLRKLKSAVKASGRQSPRVQKVLARFPVKSLHVTEVTESDRIQRLEPIDPARKLWYADS